MGLWYDSHGNKFVSRRVGYGRCNEYRFLNIAAYDVQRAKN
jgi:hypothetical protein